MSVDLSPLLDRPDTKNPNEVTHIINQKLSDNSVADASIFGTEVIALCGHKFIPTRDPLKLPLCELCKLAFDAMT